MPNRTEHRGRWLAGLFLSMVLAGCAPASSVSVSPQEAAAAVAATQTDLSVSEVTSEDSRFDAQLERAYGISPEDVTEGTVLYADGVNASEIVVLRLTDNEAARQAVSALESYAERRAASFSGYAPDQAQIAADAEIICDGTTVMLIMCPDTAAAREAAMQMLSPAASAAPASASAALEMPQPPAAQESGYDHDAVLEAVSSGSPENLSADNRAVYDKVSEVLSALILPEMTPYEQELAVHDWMTANIDYDPAELEHGLASGQPSPDNDNPVGALVYGKAICSGYSSTFQLFMDVLGIPCITIDGQANAPAEPHSWNAVELDGQWYYVDVTWDDPVTGVPGHRYLNQTTAYLEEHGPHIWDREGLPEIAAEPYGG
ncbi:MAG: DUF4358 domain-containing protein [Clostridia bacterium]|nr:DUF4358 domain-containing protein [Clostridia bacterium]